MPVPVVAAKGGLNLPFYNHPFLLLGVNIGYGPVYGTYSALVRSHQSTLLVASASCVMIMVIYPAYTGPRPHYSLV